MQRIVNPHTHLGLYRALIVKGRRRDNLPYSMPDLTSLTNID